MIDMNWYVFSGARTIPHVVQPHQLLKGWVPCEAGRFPPEKKRKDKEEKKRGKEEERKERGRRERGRERKEDNSRQ